ncbi:MAG: hypothetical protein FJX46_03995 [Alphaproteobacteria bacterium]|nr:hypothetical protein [Alphaproteobacteria bacterium]
MRHLAIAAIGWLSAAALPTSAQTPPIIDTHMHVDGRLARETDWARAARLALERMDQVGIAFGLVLPPPQPPGFADFWECDEYARPLAPYRARLGLICGGGSINRLIYRTEEDGPLDPAITARLDELVGVYAGLGAVAIGELTAQHFSFEPRHPYLGRSPDHPAFLRLADLAARHRLPLVLHMEAVRGGFATPQGLRRLSNLNPERIGDNLAAFERLLAHNREATIVWAHYGWDNTGQRDAGLMAELFARHPNLMADLKIQPGSPAARAIVDPGGGLRADFVAAVEAMAERLMIGSDAFHALRDTPASRQTERLTGATRLLLERLSPAAARQIAYDNAVRIYRLRERGLVP